MRRLLLPWCSVPGRLGLLFAALVGFGIMDIEVVIPRFSVTTENNSLTFHHRGWERMKLRERSRTMLIPGNRLQPSDVHAGAAASAALAGTRFQGELEGGLQASLGSCKPFFGDLHKPGMLQAALQARSWANETVIIPFGAPDLGLALNMVVNLRALSYDHVLLLGATDDACRKAVAAIPDVGCAWSTYLAGDEVPFFPTSDTDRAHAMERLLFIRWHVIARAVRLGYNVMTMDADSHLSDDPYIYLKSPPMADANLVTMTHGTLSGMATGGFVYAQNAALDGPVSWILTDMVDRVLRYADDPQFLERLGLALPEAFHHIAREDCLLSDATASAVLGRQLAWQGLWGEGEGRAGLERGGKRVDQIWHAHKALFDKEKVRKTVEPELSQEAQKRLGIHRGSFLQYALRVPEADVWADELGGRILPDARGPLSAEWRALLAEESPPVGGPPAGGAKSGTGRGVQERLLQPAMYGALMENAHNGLWNGAFQRDPRPVFFAIMYGVRASIPARPLVMKALGMWDWEVTDIMEAKALQVARLPMSQRKVLAFSPDALPLRLKSEAEVRAALMGLVQVAALAGRAPVWPDYACDSPWLQAAPGQDGAGAWIGERWRPDVEVVPRLPLVNVEPSERRCLVWHFYRTACDAHGMNLLDFFYLRDKVLRAANPAPTPANTVLSPEEGGGNATAAVRFAGDTDLDGLAASLEAMKGEAVVYLGRPVNIGTLGSRTRVEEAVRMVQEQCLAEMFRISMDRKTYTPWQEGGHAEGEDAALEEVRELDEGRREAAPDEAAAAAQLPPLAVGLGSAELSADPLDVQAEDAQRKHQAALPPADPLAAEHERERLAADEARRPALDAEKQPGVIALDKRGVKESAIKDAGELLKDDDLDARTLALARGEDLAPSQGRSAPSGVLGVQASAAGYKPVAELTPVVEAIQLADDLARRPALDAEKQPGKIELDKQPLELSLKEERKAFKDELLEEVEALAQAAEGAAGRAPLGGMAGGAPIGAATAAEVALDQQLLEDLVRRPAEGAEKQPEKVELVKAPEEAPPGAKIFKDKLLEEDPMVRAMAGKDQLGSAPAPGKGVAREERLSTSAVNPAIVDDIMRRPDDAAEKQPGKIVLEKAPEEAAPPETKIFKDELLEEDPMVRAMAAAQLVNASAQAPAQPAGAEEAAAAFAAKLAKPAAAAANSGGLSIVDVGRADVAGIGGGAGPGGVGANVGAGGEGPGGGGEAMSVAEVARVERHRRRSDRLQERLAAREASLAMGEASDAETGEGRSGAEDTERQRNRVREAADTGLEVESGGELLSSLQIGYASSAQAEPVSSAQARIGAAAAASGAAPAEPAAQKRPAEELGEAEESRLTGASTGARPWRGGWESIGPGRGADDAEPAHSMLAALNDLEELLTGTGIAGLAGSAQAAGGVDSSGQESPADAGGAAEPVQGSAAPVLPEEGAAAVLTGS